jgi:hypothetical protein
MKSSNLLILLGFFFTLFSCADTIPTSTNKPYAAAGSDQTVAAGSSVVLDGSGSYDLKRGELNYSWKFGQIPPTANSTLDNTSLKALNAKNSIVQFTPDVAGTYNVILTVNNGKDSDTDNAIITVSSSGSKNAAPIASAGANQTATVGTTVILDGTGSSDPDGDRLTYSWAFATSPPVTGSSLTNSSFVAKTSDKSIVEFTPDTTGNFVVELTVSDGARSDTDSLVVRVN